MIKNKDKNEKWKVMCCKVQYESLYNILMMNNESLMGQFFLLIIVYCDDEDVDCNWRWFYLAATAAVHVVHCSTYV